jgi:RNA polymerase sigma-70 factor (ECF subfamily)
MRAPAPPAAAGVDVDVDVVLRAQRGDRVAFAALYRRYFRVVHGVLLARVSPADAEDVAQEVFVVAAQKLAQLTTPSAIGPWLCTIARTRAVDHHRKRREVLRGDDVDVDDDGSAGVSGVPGADTVVDARRALVAVRGLPEAYRETLVLRLVEGLTGPEIAAATGLTEGSVRVNLHRGMALLKEALSS